MEGAIKLIQFCMEQRKAGIALCFEYTGNIDRFEFFGWSSMLGTADNWITDGASEFWIKPEDLTPERADEIIQIINDRIAKL